jgi:predicted O-methyltransferase YrrM
MQQRKLKLGVVAFPYSGSGGGNAETSDIRNWLIPTILKAKSDPRIEPEIWNQDYNDTPITMTRNRAVVDARRAGVDVLLMIDADMQPDCESGTDPEARPFFDTSFDFIYSRWDKGPHVVCAPYCGPPPFEWVYVFYWETDETGGQNQSSKLTMYRREHAAIMKGIQPCAAQPTGLIMWDMRAFDLTDPKHQYDALIEQGVGPDEARLRVRSWFEYEWEDIYHSDKGSTEDVTATRDISMHGLLNLGYSPIYCNWDAWAGHHKNKVVRKPRVIFADTVSEKYRVAVESKQAKRSRRMFIDSDLPKLQKPIIDQTPRGVNDGIIRQIGFATARQDLDALQDRERPLFIEVGSWVGESALALSRGAAKGIIDCVDTWEGTASDQTGRLCAEAGKDAIFEAFKKNTEGKSISYVREDSISAATLRQWTQADMIHLDADHTYEALSADIRAWWPHLRDGGVMSFHDFYSAGFPGVTQAVQEAFPNSITHIPGTAVAWVRKNDETTRTLEGSSQKATCCHEGAC